MLLQMLKHISAWMTSTNINVMRIPEQQYQLD
jgi:hypothetical protein